MFELALCVFLFDFCCEFGVRIVFFLGAQVGCLFLIGGFVMFCSHFLKMVQLFWGIKRMITVVQTCSKWIGATNRFNQFPCLPQGAFLRRTGRAGSLSAGGTGLFHKFARTTTTTAARTRPARTRT